MTMAIQYKVRFHNLACLRLLAYPSDPIRAWLQYAQQHVPRFPSRLKSWCKVMLLVGLIALRRSYARSASI
jgi:hypothetical protein